MSVIRQMKWVSILTLCGVAVMAAEMSFTTIAAYAAFELPQGERITHLPAVSRSIPQKEEY